MINNNIIMVGIYYHRNGMWLRVRDSTHIVSKIFMKDVYGSGYLISFNDGNCFSSGLHMSQFKL